MPPDPPRKLASSALKKYNHLSGLPSTFPVGTATLKLIDSTAKEPISRIFMPSCLLAL